MNHEYDSANNCESPCESRCESICKNNGEGICKEHVQVTSCAICLEDIELPIQDNGQITITKCAHYFHTTCFDKWYLCCSTCALCKCELNPNGCEVKFQNYENIEDISRFNDDYN